MKDLTAAYGDLLQDKRIRAEQSKYEAISRQRNAVLSKFKKTYQTFLDIWAGLDKARQFYTEMMETAESLEKNVETFVSNRRVEGAQLLNQIEQQKGTDAERDRKLQGLMERMTMGQGEPPGSAKLPPKRPAPLTNISGHSSHPSQGSGTPTHAQSPPGTPRYAPHQYSGYPTPTPPPPPPHPPASAGYPGGYHYPPNSNGYPRRDSYGQIPQAPRRDSYQTHPMQRRDSQQALPTPTPITTGGSQPYHPGHYSSPPNMYAGQVNYPYNPSTYVPPPPPPGPPPPQQGLNPRQSFGVLPPNTYQAQSPTPGQGQGGYPQYPQQQQQGQQQQQQQDPWVGLAGWK